MTAPREIVVELDKYIIGQKRAKTAVAVALRNRWRRQQLSVEMAREILPKNILMIGPTGVGKTEAAKAINLTLLLIRGTKESAFVNGLIVVLKVSIVLLFIGIGWQFINPAHHTPFIPSATTHVTAQGITHHYGGILGILGAAGIYQLLKKDDHRSLRRAA